VVASPGSGSIRRAVRADLFGLGEEPHEASAVKTGALFGRGFPFGGAVSVGEGGEPSPHPTVVGICRRLADGVPPHVAVELSGKGEVTRLGEGDGQWESRPHHAAPTLVSYSDSGRESLDSPGEAAESEIGDAPHPVEVHRAERSGRLRIDRVLFEYPKPASKSGSARVER